MIGVRDMAYTKLFSSLLNSTVWTEPVETRVVWITMLAMADQDGNVPARAPGIAKAAGVSRPAVDKALSTFLAPDPDSRTKDHEGRRIEETAEGFHLLNYEAYRDRASKEDKLAKAAARQERWRKRNAKTVTNNAPVTLDNAPYRDVTRVTHSGSSHLISSASQAHLISTQHTETECEGGAGAPPRRRAKRAPPKDPTAVQIATAAAWDAYRVAFFERYRTEPTRNGKVNGQLAQLCKRLPVDELPHVIAWYIGSNNAHYIRSAHSVGPLLADAEALRTSWATRRENTHYQARESDKQTGRAQYVRDAIEEIDREAKRERKVMNAAAE